MKRIILAVTGGPSGGKTTLIEALKKEFGQGVIVVPEAASILYRGGFPRRKDTQGIIHIQRAIYYTQKELEGLFNDSGTASLMVCDRGSLDAVAYWPTQKSDFFSNIQSTEQAELNRYDFILHLDTAGPQFYDTENSIRTETFQEANELNSKIRLAWAKHPQRIIVKNNTDFMSKMNLCLSVVECISKGISYGELLKKFPQLESSEN